MASARDLGRAYVSIVPDTSKFRSKLRDDIKAATAGLDQKVRVDADTSRATAQVKGAVKDINKNVDEANKNKVKLGADTSGLTSKVKAATSEAAKDVDAVSKNKVKLGADTSGLTASVKRATKEANDDIENLKREAKAILADGLEFRINADDAKAIAKLDTLKARLKDFANQKSEGKTDVDTAKAQAKLSKIKADLDAFGHEHYDARADVDTALADAKLKAETAKLRLFGGMRSTAHVDVDTSRAKSALSKFFGGGGDIANIVKKGAGDAGRQGGDAFKSGFGTGLPPGVLGPIVIAALAALPAAIGVIGAGAGVALGAGIIAMAVSQVNSNATKLQAAVKKQATDQKALATAEGKSTGVSPASILSRQSSNAVLANSIKQLEAQKKLTAAQQTTLSNDKIRLSYGQQQLASIEKQGSATGKTNAAAVAAARQKLQADNASVASLQQQQKELSKFQKVYTDLQAQWKNIQSSLFASVANSGFLKAADDAVNKLGAEFKKLEPVLQNLFSASAPYIQPFVTTLLDLVRTVLPGLTSMLNAAKGPLTAFISGLGGIVGTQIGSWFKEAAPFIKQSGQFFDELLKIVGPLGQILIAAGGALASILGPALKLVTSLITPLVPAFTMFAQMLSRTLGPVIGQIAGTLGKSLGPALGKVALVLVDSLAPVMKALAPIIGKLAAAFGPLLAQLALLAANLIAAILPSLTRFLVAIMPIVSEIVSLATAITKYLVAGLVELNKWMGVTVIPAMNKFAALIGRTVGPAMQNLAHWMMDAVNAVKTGFVPFFTRDIPHAFDVSRHEIAVFGDWVAGFFTGIWNGTRKVWDAALSGLRGAMNSTWGWMRSVTAAVWHGIEGFFVSFWNGIRGVFNGALSGIKGVLSGAWNWMKNITASVWHGIEGFFNNFWGGIRSAFSSSLSTIKGVLSGAWNWIKNVTASVWHGIEGFFSNFWNAEIQGWKNILSAIKGWISGAWNWIKNVTASVWHGIEGFFNNFWGALVGLFRQALSLSKAAISAAWNWIKNVTASVWHGIEGFFSSFWGNLVGAFRKALSDVKGAIHEAWGWIVNTTTSVWHGITSFFNNFWANEIQGWKNILSTIKGWISAAWNWIKNVTADVWHGIAGFFENFWNAEITGWKHILSDVKGAIHEAWGWIVNTTHSVFGNVESFFDSFWKRLVSGFSDVVQGIKSAWGGVSSAVQKPLQAMDNAIYAPFAHLVNTGLSIFGVKAKLPAHLIQQKKAGGGLVDGRGSGISDNIPVMMSPGEYVVKAAAVRKIGKRALDELNGNSGKDQGSVERPAFASGGQLVSSAEKWKGHRYVWGGPANPQNGWDCSSFMSYVLGSNGGKLPGNFQAPSNTHGPVASQFRAGAPQNLGQIKKGDIAVEKNGNHVGMIAANGTSANQKTIQGFAAIGRNYGTNYQTFDTGNFDFYKNPDADNRGLFGKIWGGISGAFNDVTSVLTNVASAALSDLSGWAAKAVPGNKKTIPPQLAQGVINKFLSSATNHVNSNPDNWTSGFSGTNGLSGDAGAAAYSGAASGSQTANGKAIYNYLLQNLFAGHKIAAAGATASIWGESNWNPFAQGTGGRGLIGWTPPSTISDAAFKSGLTGQLPAIIRFVQQSGDMGVIANMMKATSVSQAAQEWGKGVERYGINDVHPEGIKLATAFMGGRFGGGTIHTPSGGVPSADQWNVAVSDGERVLTRSQAQKYEKTSGPTQNDLLQQLIAHQQKTNQLLNDVANSSRSTASGVTGKSGNLRRIY